MTRAWLALGVGYALVFAAAIIGGIAKAGPDAGVEVGDRHVRAFCFRQLNPDGGEPLPLPEACFGAPTLGRAWQ